MNRNFIFFIVIALSVCLLLQTPDNDDKRMFDIKQPKINLSYPKDTDVIWSFWHDENWPPLVRLCVKSWQIHNPRYQINILSKDTIKAFIDLSTLPQLFNTFSMQHQADVIRLALLKRYGGYWLDSTIFLTQPLAIEWEPMDYEVGGYNGTHLQTNPAKVVLENWFIAAPRGSQLIADWHDEFVGSFNRFMYNNETFRGNRDAYVDSLRNKGVDLQNIVNTSYFSMHCSFLAVIHKNKYIIKSKDAGIGKNHGPLCYIRPLSFICGALKLCETPVKDFVTNHRYSYLSVIKFPSNERNMFTQSVWSRLQPNSTFGAAAFYRLKQ